MADISQSEMERLARLRLEQAETAMASAETELIQAQRWHRTVMAGGEYAKMLRLKVSGRE